MVASFESLPTEITEDIVQRSSLGDIKSLRLTCSEIATKASQGVFKNRFTNKTVDVSVQDLERATQTIVAGGLACLLENLTITGVLYETKDSGRLLRLKVHPLGPREPVPIRNDGTMPAGKTREPLPATTDDILTAERGLETIQPRQRRQEPEQACAEDLQSLTDMLSRVRKHGTYGRLKSITLDIVVYRDNTNLKEPRDGRDWRLIWETAIHTFSVTMDALARSGTCVDRLDIYSKLPTCSVPGVDIANNLGQAHSVDIGNVISSLKSLSLSTSTQLVPAYGWARCREVDPADEILDPPIHRHSHFTASSDEVAIADNTLEHQQATHGLTQLLQRTSRLEKLKLHYYCLLHDDGNECPVIIKDTVRLTHLQYLKDLTLQGIRADAQDVLALLQQSPLLTSLALCFLRLIVSTRNGSGWKAIFDHVTLPGNNFEHLHFLDLFEGTPDAEAYVYFLNPSTKTAPAISMPSINGNDLRPRAFIRKGREEVLMPIEFGLNLHYTQGSPWQHLWRKEQSKEYGPPEHFL